MRTMHLTYDHVFCGMLAVPSIMVLAEKADSRLKITAGVTLGCALVLGYGSLAGIPPLADFHDPARWICGVLLCALGIAVAVQCKRPVLATLLVTGGVLEALIHLRWIS